MTTTDLGRRYNPVTGRFLQTDPIYGGGANSYAYPTDPVNMFDIDGHLWKWQRQAIAGVIFTALAALAHVFCNVNLICGALLGAVLGGIEEIIDQKWIDPAPFCLNCVVVKAAAGAFAAIGGGTIIAKRFPGFAAAIGKAGTWTIGRIQSRMPALVGIVAAFTSGIVNAISQGKR